MLDIVAISETKLKSNFSTHLEGYNFIQENSNTNAGGVGMFIKDTINYIVVHHFDLTIDSCEKIWVKINLNNIEKIIGVVYQHPNSCVSDFRKSLETTLENLHELKSQYFICGDINIDLLQSSTNVQVKSYSDMLFSLRCFLFITNPTRVTSNSATLTDHIHTNNMPHQATSHILLDDISDHMPILM